ncbi:metapyrocatechase 2 [Fusarium mexicanum]|uniref:Metapyrocatechase 2 n=1 Tax=Fusarium mexicanum TaxID=751941 RepID=A0A8H5MQZ3_9HYPO|nr:metapyrocatechase 2 [Fusarium mexicanum]
MPQMSIRSTGPFLGARRWRDSFHCSCCQKRSSHTAESSITLPSHSSSPTYSPAITRSSSPHRQSSLPGYSRPIARALSRLHNRQYLATHDVNPSPPKTHFTGLASEVPLRSEPTASDRRDVECRSYAKSDDCPSLEASIPTPPAKSRWSYSAASIQSTDTPALDESSETFTEGSDLADDNESVMIMETYRISCKTAGSTPTLVEIINTHETHSRYEDMCLREAIMPDMRIPTITNDTSKVQLSRIAHVYFEHPDLDKFDKFANDFGFVKEAQIGDSIYYRGYGIDPFVYVATKSKDGKQRFLGPAFVAASEEEFEKAAAIEGAERVSLEHAPGGGKMIKFSRQDNTFFHVVYGQEERKIDSEEPTATHEQQGPYNKPFTKPRRGKYQRYHPGPALVHKLGHFGYVVPDFDNELAWYTSNFNFVPSDILYHWDFSNMDVLTFMHLDLGDEYSDHHCFFMQRAEPHVKKIYCHHTSFEVADFDTQLLGHEYLAIKGWKSVWGVGRHVLGSQIFDYWADPSGFKIEHYADGDVVNRATGTNRDVVGPFSVWGPEVPKNFGDKIV